MKTYFQNSKWIWYHTPDLDLVNSWMQARRSFELADVPVSVEIKLTADAQYKLFINGIYVCRGPARGFQKSWPFDRVDIAPFLRAGRNVIAVLVHNPGVGNFQYIHQCWAGFILDGMVNGVDLATGPEWKTRRAPGYGRAPWRLSAQLGMQEFFDARKDDGAWVEIDYNDSGWTKKPACYPSYRPPWVGFEERGVPMLKESVFVAPQRIVATASGTSGKDYAGLPNIGTLFCSETRKWRKNACALEPCKGQAVLATLPTEQGGYHSFILEFDTEIAGAVALEVPDAVGGEIVDVIALEYVLPDGTPRIQPPEIYSQGVGMGSRLILRTGANRHEFFNYWGMQYLIVTIRDAQRPLTLKLSVRKVGFPLTGYDHFASSDANLNRIFDICCRAVECTCFDAIVDGPWREQAQWFGDTVFTSAALYALCGDSSLFARAIRQAVQQPLTDGLVHALYPSVGWNLVLPFYSLMWVNAFQRHYQMTGDIALFNECRDTILTVLDHFRMRTERDPLGLYPLDSRYWNYTASRMGQGKYASIFNILLYGAIRNFVHLSHAAGVDRETHAREWALYAERLAETVRSRFVNTETGVIYNTLDASGVAVNEPPDIISYALALQYGLCPDMNQRWTDTLVDYLGACPPEREKSPRPCSFMFIFEALEQRGRDREIIACIARCWKSFLDAGFTTTTEGWPDDNASCCHGWGSHPIAFLMRLLGGIRQTAPNWRKMRFAPVFVGTWARCRVPTPLGEISCEWRKTSGKIEINLRVPEGIEVETDIGEEDMKTVLNLVSVKKMICSAR